MLSQYIQALSVVYIIISQFWVPSVEFPRKKEDIKFEFNIFNFSFLNYRWHQQYRLDMIHHITVLDNLKALAKYSKIWVPIWNAKNFQKFLLEMNCSCKILAKLSIQHKPCICGVYYFTVFLFSQKRRDQVWDICRFARTNLYTSGV